MDLSRAVSEPLKGLVSFHDQFNQNVKVTFGALAYARNQCGIAVDGRATPIQLPTGAEPWRDREWRNPDLAIKNATGFVAELGLVRAASAFEDYLTGVKAELDRAAAGTATLYGENTTPLTGLMALLGIDAMSIADLKQVVEFFDVARNCVVHRSGRASNHLAELSRRADFAAVLERWPRRKGKWSVGVPPIGAEPPWRGFPVMRSWRRTPISAARWLSTAP